MRNFRKEDEIDRFSELQINEVDRSGRSALSVAAQDELFHDTIASKLINAGASLTGPTIPNVNGVKFICLFKIFIFFKKDGFAW